MAPERIQLVVQADDFGMCHAINAGIVRALREGIATQTSVMAPCPWIGEALELARQGAFPVGVHCTLTCEWEHLRWGPLTGGATLVAADGGFHRTVADATQHADPAEAKAEFAAQTDRLIHAGVEPLYFDGHMGPTCIPAFEYVTTKYQTPFVYPLGGLSFSFDSFEMLSQRGAEEKLSWMLDYLEALSPGTHFLCTHPGESGEELRSLTNADAENHVWTEAFRVSDLATLCDPEVHKCIEQREIELVSVEALPRPKFA